MNFNEVLFPEIILGKRGERHLQEVYKMMLEHVDIKSEKLSVSPALKDMNDSNFIRHLYITKLCLEKGMKTYHVGADFLNVLSSLDKDIPVDALPNNFCAYINFARNQLKDDDGYVEGALVYIGSTDTKIFSDAPAGKRCMFISYLNNRKPMGWMVGNLAVCLDDFERVKEVFAGFKTIDSFFNGKKEVVDEAVIQLRNIIYRTVINTVLYIHSEDPKIERASPFVKGGKVSKNELRRRGSVINECTVPITFVHRLYTRKRSYTATETFVESYPRWQRCGPQLSKIKLVWVTEHIRTFQKQHEETI